MLPSRQAQFPADVNMLTWRDNGIIGHRRLGVVIHTDESAWDYAANKPRTDGWTARRLAEYNIEAPHDGRRGSYHHGVDDKEIVRQNDDTFGTWSVGNKGNDWMFHVCIAGSTAYWTRDQWLTPKNRKKLRNAARVTAHYCLRHGFEIRKATPQDLLAQRTGIVGHWDCTKAWSNGSGHWDPGGYPDTAGGFPWDIFITLVQEEARNADTPSTIKKTVPQEAPVLNKIRSIINPSKTFTAEQTLAYIDGSIWKQERLLRALCEKQGLDPDKILKQAIDADLAGNQ